MTFTGFALASTDAAGVDLVVVEGTIEALVSLDTFDATTISFLRSDGFDKAVEHCQEIYHEIFFVYLPASYD